MLDIKRFHYCEQTHTNEQYTRIVTIYLTCACTHRDIINNLTCYTVKPANNEESIFVTLGCFSISLTYRCA